MILNQCHHSCIHNKNRTLYLLIKINFPEILLTFIQCIGHSLELYQLALKYSEHPEILWRPRNKTSHFPRKTPKLTPTQDRPRNAQFWTIFVLNLIPKNFIIFRDIIDITNYTDYDHESNQQPE